MSDAEDLLPPSAVSPQTVTTGSSASPGNIQWKRPDSPEDPPPDKPPRIAVDDFLTASGGFGWYQLRLFTLTGLVGATVVGWETFLMVFVNQVPEVTCFPNGTHSGFPSGGATRWVPTTAEEWDLVCDRRWMLTLVDSLFFVGWFFGDGIFGWLADRHGRRPAFWGSIFFTSLCGALSALIPWYSLYAVARFLTGVGTGGAATTNFVLGIEFMPPRVRSIVGCLYNGAFALGVLVFVPLAAATPSWRLLCLVTAVPGFAVFAFFPFIFESPRYFLVLGRREEAAATLNKVAAINAGGRGGHVVTVDRLEQHEGATEAGNIRDLFSPALRRSVVVMFYAWITASLVYYGLSLNISNLDTDLYVATCISSSVEFVGCLAGAVVITRFGRRPGMLITMVLAGLCCLSFVFLGDSTAGIALSMVGKFGISASYAIAYIYGCEITPTSLRGLALGVFSQGGRIGSIVAPFIVLAGQSHLIVPYIIFSIMSLLASALVLLLPETRNALLSDVTRSTASPDEVEPLLHPAEEK